MVLENVEETIAVREIDEETYEEIISVSWLKKEALTIRKQQETLNYFLFEEMELFLFLLPCEFDSLVEGFVVSQQSLNDCKTQ